MLSFFRKSRVRSLVIVALCGVLATVAGCSALRIAYGTAPDLVYWWLDGYLDLTSAQTPRVRNAIGQWFAWHRRTQLPDYAGLLVKAQAEVLADTTPARVCEWQADATRRARAAFEKIAPAAAELMPTVTAAQIAHLEQRYEKKNAEFRDDYLQPDLGKRADEALKRTVDRAETLYGRLGEAQRARIVDGLKRSPFDPEVWLAERRERQQEVLQILRKAGGSTPEQALVALRAHVGHLEVSPREPYRRYSARLNEFNCGFAASLHNATTATQRRAAAKRLAGWEDDLRAIAASKAPLAPGEPAAAN